MNNIKKLAVGCFSLIFALVVYKVLSSDSGSLPDRTVMITTLDRSHGGSGTILQSTEQSSYVLTNVHICNAIRAGGLVITETGSHAVVSYKESTEHDLCLIRVNANLHLNTRVADRAPASYEPAVVSGHPNLYPTVVTYGHFSGKSIQLINVGTRACTEAEAKDPVMGIFCLILGRIPLIRAYETILVTATIMPGSSGSGVYNSKGEISGVVFAGQGNLGYALVVPYEYVYRFLTVEVLTLQDRVPDYTQNFVDDSSRIKSYDVVQVCNLVETDEQQYLCSILKDSIDFSL